MTASGFGLKVGIRAKHSSESEKKSVELEGFFLVCLLSLSTATTLCGCIQPTQCNMAAVYFEDVILVGETISKGKTQGSSNSNKLLRDFCGY